MVNVLFICHGNICRSPMAEFIFRDMVKRGGYESRIFCSSCATSTEEIWGGIGNPVYPPAAAELAAHEIDCGGKRAVQLKKDDYRKYDYLICMDKQNVKNALRIIGSDPDDKLSLILDFTNEKGEVADPWYSGNFALAYKQIHNGCECLLSFITKGFED